MKQACAETDRRRRKQLDYNEAHGITPRTIRKSRAEIMQQTVAAGQRAPSQTRAVRPWRDILKGDQSPRALIERLTDAMHRAATDLDFEQAAQIRDRIEDLKAQ